MPARIRRTEDGTAHAARRWSVDGLREESGCCGPRHAPARRGRLHCACPAGLWVAELGARRPVPSRCERRRRSKRAVPEEGKSHCYKIRTNPECSLYSARFQNEPTIYLKTVQFSTNLCNKSGNSSLRDILHPEIGLSRQLIENGTLIAAIPSSR